MNFPAVPCRSLAYAVTYHKSMTMHLTVLDHPLVDHKLTVLRDKNTPSNIFRELVSELVTLEAYEATRRDENTLDIITYANRLPDDLTDRQCFLLDPMLATGGTLVAAIKYLKERGAKDITAIDILAAPEGLDRLEKEVDPSIDFKVVVCAVDEKLNDKAYIIPGLGDAGDRLYGLAE